jgi:hypothetical protein
MKHLLAILAVFACVAFGSQPAFAQNRHHDHRSNLNVQISPWGSSITIGGRNGGLTISDGYYNGYRPNGYYNGYRRYDRGYDYRYDNRRYDRRYDRGYDNRYYQPRPVLRQPYYYYDRFGRQIFVDAYGNQRIVSPGYRGGRW